MGSEAESIEKIQSQFFKKLLCLPQCTPNYTGRIEMGICHLAVTIFKLVFRWIQKILLMPSERYPHICFERLLLLDENSSNIEKYNWISIIRKGILSPYIGVRNME